MSLSDKFCIERHKNDFFDLVKNHIDIIFANENEMLALLDTIDLKKTIDFCKSIKKLVVITRSDKGSLAVFDKDVIECEAIQNLKIIDLTGAGDLFLSGFLNNYIKKKILKSVFYLELKWLLKLSKKLVLDYKKYLSALYFIKFLSSNLL